MTQPSNFLLVDDDETNNLLCGLTIRKYFGKVDIKSFTSPVVALKHIQEHNDTTASRRVLFLDINMPEMTGWEFLEAFGKLDDNIKGDITTYIMSSSLDARDREKSESIPLVSGYVCKPLSIDRLKSLFPGDVAVAVQ